jgi:hypothetical protein
MERTVADPNERENHRDLHADRDDTQTCSDRAVAQILIDEPIQQSNLRGQIDMYDQS